jgi:hypothetical protein
MRWRVDGLVLGEEHSSFGSSFGSGSGQAASKNIKRLGGEGIMSPALFTFSIPKFSEDYLVLTELFCRENNVQARSRSSHTAYQLYIAQSRR